MTPDDPGAPPPMFYSQAAQIAGQLAPKASPQQYRAALLNKGVKPDEIKHSGFDETFAGRDKIGRDELVGHFHRTLPALQETVLRSKNTYPHKTAEQWQGAIDAAERAGNWDEQARLTNAWEAHEGKGGAGATKFHSYTLPGGQNYREVLLSHTPALDRSKIPPDWRIEQLSPDSHRIRNAANEIMGYGHTPDIAFNQALAENNIGGGHEWYQSSHWDQPNVVAHLRLSDRDKGKTLHVEELQSDWAQEGRKKGFKQPVTQAEIEEGARLLGDMGPNTSPEDRARYQEIARRAHGVPHAPYVDSTAKWTDLALKRVLYEAAKGGYQRVVITPGEEQAKRYDLSKQLKTLTYTPEHKFLQGKPASGQGVGFTKDNVNPEDLPDLVGKEVADRLLKTPLREVKPLSGKHHHLEGLDLRVGGEGMKAYYDKIVPVALHKLAKRHDPEAKITRRTLGAADTPLHNLEITPKMRESILRGQAAYASGGKVEHELQKASGGSVNHAPSEAQKAAGNYAKKHISFQGIPITIENEMGSVRSGRDRNGKAWSCKLPADYGYVKRTEGADGDHVDVYVGPDKHSNLVVIVDQQHLGSRRFDEHKCILGTRSEKAALKLYCDGFSDGRGRDRIGHVKSMSVDAFKRWLKSDKTTKPAARQDIVAQALNLVGRQAHVRT